MDRWKILKNNFNREDLLKSSLDILLKKETVFLRVFERELKLIEFGKLDR